MNDKGFYDKLASLKELVAVKGNMDSFNLQKSLPIKRVVNAGNFKIGLIHGWGYPNGIIGRIKNEFEDVNAIVFGHTHKPLNCIEDGILFFNPGSPTDKLFTKTKSYGVLEIGEEIAGNIITF